MPLRYSVYNSTPMNVSGHFQSTAVNKLLLNSESLFTLSGIITYPWLLVLDHLGDILWDWSRMDAMRFAKEDLQLFCNLYYISYIDFPC